MLVSMYVLISDLYVLYKTISLGLSTPPHPHHTHTFRVFAHYLNIACLSLPCTVSPHLKHISLIARTTLHPPPLSLSWLSPETILISLIAPPSLPSFYPIHTKLILFSSLPPSLSLLALPRDDTYIIDCTSFPPPPLSTLFTPN